MAKPTENVGRDNLWILRHKSAGYTAPEEKRRFLRSLKGAFVSFWYWVVGVKRISPVQPAAGPNMQFTDILDPVPVPDAGNPTAPRRAWRSRHFLVQEHEDGPGIRLSVCRSDISLETGAGITWDELQTIKRGCGYASAWAVEVFPPDSHIVNVANMRHLWILPEAPEFGWKPETT